MIRARSKLACAIAGIEPQKLKDAIALEHLSCVPTTARRSARIFNVDQIVMLKIYALGLRIGYSSARAGAIACGILWHLQRIRAIDSIEAEAVEGARVYFGQAPMIDSEQLLAGVILYKDAECTQPTNEGNKHRLGFRCYGPDTPVLEFPIGAIRREIIERLEDEVASPVVGEDITD